MVKTLGIIPARAGSTRLPNKNMLKLNGKPMIYWTIEAATHSDLDGFVVTSNDYHILRYARGLKVPFHIRNSSLCDDRSNIFDTIEVIAMLYQEYDRFCLLNPTSPLRTAADINAALAIDNHSVISVYEDPNFWWIGKKRLYSPPRARTQDRSGQYVENGAIFIMDRYVLVQGDVAPKNSKNTSLYIMPKERSIDVDTIRDFKNAEQIMELVM